MTPPRIAETARVQMQAECARRGDSDPRSNALMKLDRQLCASLVAAWMVSVPCFAAQKRSRPRPTSRAHPAAVGGKLAAIASCLARPGTHRISSVLRSSETYPTAPLFSCRYGVSWHHAWHDLFRCTE